jgi:rRNA biogenesis protein RRP5
MGSLKRKEGPNGTSASKSARPSTEARPSKRAKASESTKDNARKGAKEPKSPAKPAAVTSLLKEEEPLFPRGGGSVLTPLEQKQISIQAKQDVLFEEQSGGKKGDKTTRKKKRKSRADETSTKPVKDEDAVKIESLNFKVSQIPKETTAV